MCDEQTVLKLIERIYDAAGDANVWRTFLEELSRAMQSASAMLIVRDPLGEERAFAVQLTPSRAAGCNLTVDELARTLHRIRSDRASGTMSDSTGSTLTRDAASHRIVIRRPAGVEPFRRDDLDLVEEKWFDT